MNIAVDCRYIGKSGIGRVCEGIIDNLDYSLHNFYLIGNPEKLSSYKNATIIEDKTDPYSFKGLLSFDKKLNKICDALIIPNFIIPFGVKIPIHSVMHDLAFLDVKETTKGFKDKLIKKILLKRCMKKSKSIATDSNFTKLRCEFYYKKLAKKCYVNYVGLCKDILNSNIQNLEKNNNIVFVGNVKPHKGLKTLIDAYKKLGETDLKLKIIGEKENFAVGLDVSDVNVDGIEFTGRISDEELFNEIASAKALVLPSWYEGFGLPPLEALYFGTKPIISDIDVFKEIYNDLDVEFFKLKDSNDLAEKIKIIDSSVKTTREEIIKRYNYKTFVNKIIEKIK